MTKINITKLAAQLDCMMNEWSYFANKSTGEIFSFDTHISPMLKNLTKSTFLIESSVKKTICNIRWREANDRTRIF